MCAQPQGNTPLNTFYLFESMDIAFQVDDIPLDDVFSIGLDNTNSNMGKSNSIKPCSLQKNKVLLLLDVIVIFHIWQCCSKQVKKMKTG